MGGWSGGDRPGFSGAVGLRVSRARGLVEAGRAAHEVREYPSPVQRSLVVGGRLVTISEDGLEVGRLDTLAEQAFLAFPRPEPPPSGPTEPQPGPRPAR
jgi:hypothetical protein